MVEIIFFIFMPIIFEFICFLISHKYLYWHNGCLEEEIILFSFLAFIDYVIEFVYLIIISKSLGVWNFCDSFDNVYIVDFGIFTILYIAFILLVSTFSIDLSYDIIPISHTVFFIICFAVFCSVELYDIHEYKDNEVFESLKYQEEESVIYLQAMEDGREVSGEIRGRNGYIYGKIEEIYNLYYAFVDDGKLIIRSIPYDESNVNIYEIGDNGDPRIVFHKYYKSYICEDGHDKYDEYYIYDIYIPSISNSIKIDME